MTTKLYVGNLSWNTSRDDLYELFGRFGNVEDAFCPVDRESGGCRRPRRPRARLACPPDPAAAPRPRRPGAPPPHPPACRMAAPALIRGQAGPARAPAP
jgi:hypothetical protein